MIDLDATAIDVTDRATGAVSRTTVGAFGAAHPRADIHAIVYRLITFGRAVYVRAGLDIRVA